LRGEHREMRDNVASLKRMLQKVLAHKLQGEGAPAATLPQ